MRLYQLLVAILIAVVVVLALTIGTEAKKRNRNRGDSDALADVTGRKKHQKHQRNKGKVKQISENIQTEVMPTAEIEETLPVPVQESGVTTVDGGDNEPVPEPDVEPSLARREKHHRNKDSGRHHREDKTHKKEKNPKKSHHRKHNREEISDETVISVNPTPSPAADGAELTPSGPSPLQSTEQEPQEPEVKGSKKKQKGHKTSEREHRESKAEKRLHRLERKRKNATKVACTNHVDCSDGQCCLMRKGKKVCHAVNKPEGHHCVHDCMCSQGLECVSKMKKHKTVGKAHCRKAAITDIAAEGATTKISVDPGSEINNNELPE